MHSQWGTSSNLVWTNVLLAAVIFHKKCWEKLKNYKMFDSVDYTFWVYRLRHVHVLYLYYDSQITKTHSTVMTVCKCTIHFVQCGCLWKVPENNRKFSLHSIKMDLACLPVHHSYVPYNYMLYCINSGTLKAGESVLTHGNSLLTLHTFI
jgi:hypothetical protein